MPVQSPLASTTPPPLSMDSVRRIAKAKGACLPPDMLVALQKVFLAQGSEPQARELEELFDFETGLPR
ncbi:MAG: hypothetical protein JST00_39625 [Deltaproteobacteria bacterium]|nr:hypothetical protein [Deltaproteobacteria bacterium]